MKDVVEPLEKDMKEIKELLKEVEVIVDEKHMNVGGPKVMLIGEIIPKF